MPKVDVEDGLIRSDEAEASVNGTAPAEATRVARVVDGALSGVLRRDRALHPWEPSTLNPLHINMVLDRASGLKPSEIAEKYDLSLARVSVILHHPDSEQIYHAVLSQAADQIADPVQRLQGYAHEMLDIKMEIVRSDKTSNQLRDKIASDILDRAGLSARKHIDVEHEHKVSMRQDQAEALISALDEANRVAVVDYTRFLARPQESEVPKRGLPSGAGHSEVAAGASTGASSGVSAQQSAA